MEINTLQELWQNHEQLVKNNSSQTEELLKKIISQNIQKRFRHLHLHEMIGTFVLGIILFLSFFMISKLPQTGIFIGSFVLMEILLIISVIWQIYRFRVVGTLNNECDTVADSCSRLQKMVTLIKAENKFMPILIILFVIPFSIVFWKTIKNVDFFEAITYSWYLRLYLAGTILISIMVGYFINKHYLLILSLLKKELSDISI